MQKITLSIVQKYRDVFSLAWYYAEPWKVYIGSFIALAVFGAITESFGVFLLVPLLETMGKNNIFSNTPLLGFISQFFDSLPSESRLLWAGVLMLVVVLLRGIVQFVQEFIGYAIPHKVDFSLRLQAYHKLLGANVQFVDGLGAGELSNFAVGHPARIGIALRFFATLISSIFVLASYVLVLLIVAPYMCIVAFVYVAAATLVYRRMTTSIVHQVGHNTTAATEAFSQLFYDTLNGSKLIRLSGATRIIEGKVKAAVARLEKAKDRTVAVENMTIPFFSVMGGILICALVIFVGTLEPETAARTTGILVIFIVLIFRILAPLSIINISRNNIIIHLDALVDYKEMLTQANAAQDRNGTVAIKGIRKGISLDTVSFRYSEDADKALDDLSLDIPQGSMVGIVGTSGSGKSTMVNLLTRLYRPDEGQVTVDGNNLNDLEIEAWWRCLSVVMQDTLLTNDTIRDNIRFGLENDLPESRLHAAARQAAIHDWIMEQPEGYDTLLTDRGGNLSGGQRQRVMLARAFLRDPDIFIFDEATSALDSLTEKTVQDNILALKGDKTLIVIAHRLSLVQHADTILVFDRGRVVEQGSHADLLKKQGIYWQMTEQQSLATE